jgi:hypothetical protein
MHFSSPPHNTCHMPHHLITVTIFGQQYKSWCSSLTNVLWSSATSSLLGPNKTGTQLWHKGIRRHNSVTKCILLQLHTIIKKQIHLAHTLLTTTSLEQRNICHLKINGTYNYLIPIYT